MDIDFSNPSTDDKFSQFLSALTGDGLIVGISCAKITLDPPSMATTVDGNDTATFPGSSAKVGDGVVLIPPYDMQEVMFSGAVSAANTIEASFYNAAAGTINLGSSADWLAIVLHRKATP